MDNVTNWLLGQRLMERMQNPLSSMQGWTIPQQQSPNAFDEAPLQSGGLTGLAELRDQSSDLRTLSEFRPPSMPSGFQSAQSPAPAPDDCFGDPDAASTSAFGHDFCTRRGGFTRFPADPKTGIRTFRFEGSFTGRDSRGNIRTYPGGATISVSPDGTVTVDSDI